jgi:F0F1-type ATP synthase assembly protein I
MEHSITGATGSAWEPTPWRAVQQAAWGDAKEQRVNVGITLVISTVIGLAGGYYADRWLGTAPWLTMIGLGVGIAAGFVNLFRSTK